MTNDKFNKLIEHILSDKTKDDLIDRSIYKNMDLQKEDRFNSNPKNYATILLFKVLERLDMIENKIKKIGINDGKN
jgi:hypothetical protein